MRRKLHAFGAVRILATTIALVALVGCNSESSDDAPYDGTLGDAMIEFVDTVGALADILSDINNLDDCHEARGPISYQVKRLRQLHGVVGSMSVKTWAEMPRSLDEKRRAEIRRFNAEAVRVLIKQERGVVLRDLIEDVPALIYPELQS